MKRSPRNKMLGSEDYRTKKEGGGAKRKKRRFYFPKQKKSIEAESYEEALRIINR